MKHRIYALGLFVGLLALAGCETEKSRNPLSPSIAGPIEGVEISPPALMSPASGALIKVSDQPVRVAFANGQSNGERVVFHALRVARDAEMTQVAYEALEIPSDPSGQTSYELPMELDPEQMYYWSVQAVDGANSSEPSRVETFEVYTPVTITPPEIQFVDGGTAGGSSPRLVINVGDIEGPASELSYTLEVAEDASFNQVVFTHSGVIEGTSVAIDVTTLFGASGQSGQDLEAASRSAYARSAQAVTIRGNTTYHWRARVSAEGRAGTVHGPWSATRTLTTPSNPNELLAPTPVSPRGGTTTSSTTPTLVVTNPSVGTSFGAVTIRFDVATDQAFRNIVSSPSAGMSNGTTTSAQTRALSTNTPHYWRVRAQADGLVGPWSSTQSFRTPSSSSGGGSSGGGGGGGSADQLNLSSVVWLHHNVRNWPKTSTITSVSLGNPPICVGHTKAGRWPALRHSSGILVEGNPWVFAKIGGKWYGATWEWLRPGQTCKGLTGRDFRTHVAGASPLSGWTPRSGEKVGFMVSTPARFGPMGSVHERSNVVIVTWP